MNKEAIILSATKGKTPGKNGHKPKEGSLAAMIDPYLFAGKHTVRQIAELVAKRAGKLSAHVDLKANCRARLWNFKKKGYVVQRDDKRRVHLLKKS